MLDSSLLVEKAKRTRVELFDILMQRNEYEKCICSPVLSEFTFHLLAIEGGKAPRTLKENRLIPALLTANPPDILLHLFTLLPDSSQTISIYIDLMIKYNLLPNDALILSACLLHNIPYLASYDQTDFEKACAGEGVILISDFSDLN
ncbi:PIN domain-containing protein [Larkinella knui]|nr:PIN domain-containing protein [Larkinella knui]